MGFSRKSGCILLISLILINFLIPYISSEVVVVPDGQQQQTTEKKGFFDTYFGFLKEPIFWYVIVGLILFMAILVGLFFLVRWLVKYLKAKDDIFYKLKIERVKLAKIQRRYPSKSWYKVHKNTPIRLVKKEKGKLVVSNPIAYHRGDFTTHEGNVIISMNLKDKKKFFFLPITDLLIIPNKEKVEIQKKNNKGKMEVITIDNLPQAKDVVQFNEDEILIFAESISNMGIFYAPVLIAKDGKIVDLSLPVYQSLREVILGDYLYEQTAEFVNVAKKSIDLNPNLRYQMKAGDNSQNVDVPSGNNQNG